MYLFDVKPQLAGANVPWGIPGVERHSAKYLQPFGAHYPRAKIVDPFRRAAGFHG
jgi:hypothetical protein